MENNFVNYIKDTDPLDGHPVLTVSLYIGGLVMFIIGDSFQLDNIYNKILLILAFLKIIIYILSSISLTLVCVLNWDKVKQLFKKNKKS